MTKYYSMNNSKSAYDARATLKGHNTIFRGGNDGLLTPL